MIPNRDIVFVAGGQPNITYVDRQDASVANELARAIAAPNQIVSLAGPSKSGKTVLCRHIMNSQPFVWVNGGEVKTATALWDKVCSELNFPVEKTVGDTSESKFSGGIKGLIFSLGGSQLESSERQRTYKIDSIASATTHLKTKGIALVVDDFHYLSTEARQDFVRSVKGAVYDGLKVVLLAVPHRVFDALKAEEELVGRFESVTIPDWAATELARIPRVGFGALNVKVPKAMIEDLVAECQSSPFLMQKFCWEICYANGVNDRPDKAIRVPAKFDMKPIYSRLSKDAGRITYDELRGGPQIRKDRQKRPLVGGGEADVYEIVLRAISETGPKQTLAYGELRKIIEEMVESHKPLGNEITSVLKYMAQITSRSGRNAGVDWDESGRVVSISDPFFRLFLRWQIRSNRTT